MLCNHHRRRLRSLASCPGGARRRPLPSNTTMPPIFRGSTMRMLLLSLLFWFLAMVEHQYHVHAFSPSVMGWKRLLSIRTKGQCENTMLATSRPLPRLRLKNAQEDNDNDIDTNTNNLPQGFNPLNYNAAANSRGAGPSSSSTSFSSVQNVISLRQTRMQQVMAELLNAASVEATKANTINDEKEQQQPALLQAVLEEHRDFLLEPLEDEDAVQDPNDSIYTDCASRAERYRAFEQTMAERIQRARDPTAKRVLTALRDFVLACE